MMSAQVISDAETALGHLERLTDLLRDRGWTVEIATPADRRPSATVANPALSARSESVIATREPADGSWSYFYGWGGRIAPCADPGRAVTVLTPMLTGPHDN
jgi:hypothetical protein